MAAVAAIITESVIYESLTAYAGLETIEKIYLFFFLIRSRQEVSSLKQAANHIHGLSVDGALDCVLSFLNLRVCV